jgi:hypothetical protein
MNTEPFPDNDCPCNTHAADFTLVLQGGTTIDVGLCDVWGISLGSHSEEGDGATVSGITVTEARAIATALNNAAGVAVTQ